MYLCDRAAFHLHKPQKDEVENPVKGLFTEAIPV